MTWRSICDFQAELQRDERKRRAANDAANRAYFMERRLCEWCGRPATNHGTAPRCAEHDNERERR